MKTSDGRLLAHQGNLEEIHRIEFAYAERDRTLSGTLKRDQSNPGNQWLQREHRGRLEQILRERLGRPLPECRVLDVGCGYGSLLGWFHELGIPAENLFGVDLLANRIEVARRTYPQFTFIHGNAESSQFANGSFDLLSAFTVFSSILDSVMARTVAQTMMRVLKDEGAIVWYDMRYPNPLNRHLTAMTKQRIHGLFPELTKELETISLLPPIARRLGSSTHWAYPALASIPVLRSHYLGLLRPRF
jgi:ubiquinone/menaquinone biosynthesis C-methylase UbiE